MINSDYPAAITRKCRQKVHMTYINPWSVCNKALEIADMIVDKEMDILAIAETWFTGDAQDRVVEQDLVPAGYSIAQHPRKTGRGGGVALIYRSSLKVKWRPHMYDTFECLESSIYGSVMARICIIYRSPSSKGGKHFLEEFSDFLSSMICSQGNLILVGDFNYHVNDPSDSGAMKFQETLKSFNLEQLVTKPTHRSGNILDLVIAHEEQNMISSIDVMDYGFPDHYAVTMELHMEKPNVSKKNSDL